MSKNAELHNLFYSFSGDSTLTAHNRSGDSTGDGAERWNFIGSVQSAEADIIDEEERTEQQEAKRKFTQLLGLYFKKILMPGEFKFLAACMRGDKTPYAVGRSLGVNYEETIATINAKHKANMPKLLQLMRACGYDYRRGIVLMPKWAQYVKRRIQIRATVATWRNKYPERVSAANKRWRIAHASELAGRWSRWWATTTEERRQAYRERTNAKRAANREAYNARQREYYQNNEAARQAKAEYSRERYQSLTPEQREAKRERDRLAKQRERERNREAYNERQRQYRAAHREQMREYDRKRWERRKAQTQESARA